MKGYRQIFVSIVPFQIREAVSFPIRPIGTALIVALSALRSEVLFSIVLVVYHAR